MSSGFIEIAALGQQDVHLTGSPDVTYFSSVYKRHTPFVLEAFEVPFKASSISMGQNNIVLIPPKGDLIRATTLKLSLPPLATYGQDWFWNQKPGAALPSIVIDGTLYYATIPTAGQFYSSIPGAFAEWSASLGGKVIYDANSNKFIITATSYVVVDDPNFTSLISSGVFWGFDPKNFVSRSGAGLRYNAKNGMVIPDFTLEQAGWSRSIGDPINLLSGLFLTLVLPIVLNPDGFFNLQQRYGDNLIGTDNDLPVAYTITPGGRINFVQNGIYILRSSSTYANGNGTILIGSDGGDGQPLTTNFWQTNLNPDVTNALTPYSIPINVTDVTQNWYLYIQGSPFGQGSYVSLQPIDDYFGPSTTTPSTTPITNTVGYPFNISNLGQNGGAITVDGNGVFTFNQLGQFLISGIINTPVVQNTSPSIITSVQLAQGSNLIFTYDASSQLAESSTEFFIPVRVSNVANTYSLFFNTVNGTNGNVLPTSFLTFTYLGLPNGGTALYPTGGLILPLNGLLFEPNAPIQNPLNFSSNFNEYGVENIFISLDGTGNIKFNNVGTYMITTYLPLVDPTELAWDSTLAFPNMFLSKQKLTVTANPLLDPAEPIMTLSSLFPSGTKLMFRVSMDYVVGTDCTAIGIGNQDLDVANYLGYNSNSFGYFDNGTIFTGGAHGSPSGLPLLQTSNVVDIAVDTTANMMLWVRIDGGEWTSNTGGVGGNPVAGTNGFDISYMGIVDPYKFGVNVYYDRVNYLPGQITYHTWASSLVTPPTTAWDPILAYPYLELSNQNLTVTGLELLSQDDHDHPPMLLSNVFPTGTKLMFSVTMDYVVGTQTVVGIGNLSLNTSNFLGNDSSSFGYFDTGLPYANGTMGTLTAGPLFVTHSVVDIAVDTTSNKMMWVRVDNGGWSSSGGGEGADPSAAELGFDISYCITGASYKFGVNVWYDTSGGQITFNTTALYEPPTGFTFVPGVGKTTDFNVPSGFTFVPGVPGTNTVTDITYSTYGGAPLPTARWDALLAGTNYNLTTNDLYTIALSTIVGTPTMLLGKVFTSGTKLMFSVDMSVSTGGTPPYPHGGLGIGNLSMDTSSSLGNDTNSFGLFVNEETYYPEGMIRNGGAYNSPVGTYPFRNGGGIIDFAVDTVNNLVWYRDAVTIFYGGWTDNTGGFTGNPEAGTGGFDISYIPGLAAGYKIGVNLAYDFHDCYAVYQTTTNRSVPTGFTFVPGVGSNNSNFIETVTLTDVTQGDTWFENLGQPIEIDSNGSIYVTDGGQDQGAVISKVLTNGDSSVFAGYKTGVSVDGLGMSAILSNVSCMTTGSYDYIYFGDYTGTGLLRVVDPAQVVRTLAGGGPNTAPYDSTGTNASFGRITSICVAGSNVVVIDDVYLRKLDLVTNQTQTYNTNSGWTTTIHNALNYRVVASNNPRYIYAGAPNYVSKIDTLIQNEEVYCGSPSYYGYFDSTRLDATFINITWLYEILNYGIYISDANKIRFLDFNTEQTYTLMATGGFVQNPENPYINENITQFTIVDGFLYYTQGGTTVMKLELSSAVETNVCGTGGPYGFRRSANSARPVNIYVRVDEAPMSYPLNIGHVGQSFAPGAFVWVYPMTSAILPPDYDQYHYYDSVGTWAIESADLKIGGQSIQTLTGEYIEIWNDLNVPYENQPALKLLTGKKDTTIATGRDYYVNLPFYFYEKSQNYLPICSLSRQDVEIHITFRTLQALTAITVDPGNQVQATLIVEYVYLDTPELNWFTKTRLEYVIDQAQYQEIDLAAGLTQDNFLLNFRNPVNSIFFAIQVNGALPYDWSNDGLQRMGLSFNGEEIVTNRITDTTQVGILEPFNNFINFPTRNFYMKTFKSPINFSRIRYVLLGLNIYRADEYYPAKKLRITAVSKNVLQINDGLGGLMFISQ